MHTSVLRVRTAAISNIPDLMEYLRAIDAAYASQSLIDDAINLLTQQGESSISEDFIKFKADEESQAFPQPYKTKSPLERAVRFAVVRRRRLQLEAEGLFGPGLPSPGESDSRQESWRLVIKSMHMNSPGVWEFLGALNPLTALRDALNDRHKRRQDLEYREQAEAKRLHHENQRLKLENMEIADRIAYRRLQELSSAGVSDQELRVITRQILLRSSSDLGEVSDKFSIDAPDPIVRLTNPTESSS